MHSMCLMIGVYLTSDNWTDKDTICFQMNNMACNLITQQQLQEN